MHKHIICVATHKNNCTRYRIDKKNTSKRKHYTHSWRRKMIP